MALDFQIMSFMLAYLWIVWEWPVKSWNLWVTHHSMCTPQCFSEQQEKEWTSYQMTKPIMRKVLKWECLRYYYLFFKSLVISSLGFRYFGQWRICSYVDEGRDIFCMMVNIFWRNDSEEHKTEWDNHDIRRVIHG